MNTGNPGLLPPEDSQGNDNTPATIDRKPKHYERATPDMLKKLAERLKDNAHTGKMVGVTAGTISTALKEGDCGASLELAAGYVLDRLDPEQLVIVRVRQSQVEKLGGMLDLIGLSHKVV